MTDIVDLYRRAVAEFDRRVAAVENDQWSDPTPCSEWDVRELVNHVTAEDLWVPPLLDGHTLEQVGDRYEGDVLGDDPVGAWVAARDAAVAAAGEASMDGLVHTSMGRMPAELFMSQVFTDHLLHSWDLARGIGADETLDPGLVEVCYSMLEPQEEMLRASGMFGDRVEVAPDADLQIRLLALVGRRG